MKTNLGEDETPTVDMAAMMDCIFLLLIFFLVAATIRKKHNELPIELYQATSNKLEKVAADNTVVISIFKRDGIIQYAYTTIGDKTKTGGGKNEIMSFQQMISSVRKAAEANNKRDFRIDSDVNVPMGTIAQIIDHLNIYQVKKIGLRTNDNAKK